MRVGWVPGIWGWDREEVTAGRGVLADTPPGGQLCFLMGWEGAVTPRGKAQSALKATPPF